MAKPGDRTTKPVELKRVSDYVDTKGAASLDGDKVDIDDILGKDIVLQDFVFIESDKYKDEKKPGEKSEFAVIQFNNMGETKKLTTACGGKVVVRCLKELPKQYLPMIIRITRKKSEKGTGKYYAVE
ncbi:MAG: hypothetical protein WC455_17190 [Dehalococcoidia bacterium]|jgi:hypothetical protein